MSDAQFIDKPYRPVRGVNSTDAPDMLSDGQVAAAVNFLFENNFCTTRPGYNPAILSPGPFAFAKGFVGPGFNLLIDDSFNVYKMTVTFPTTVATTSITGPALTLGTASENNATVVNDVILIGNNAGGIARWDYSGSTYTVMSTAPYKYVTGHLSRAVAAYQLSGGSALTNPITFAWSKPGDETTWNTAGGIDGSGSIIISDAPDFVTGLGVIYNTVVIPRVTGFHLGFPTGVAIPSAYRLETFTRDDGIGCPYPGTFTTSDNLCYFVGTDDVYTFDTNTMTPIGHPIRNELFSELSILNTSKVIGFITRVTMQSGLVNAIQPKIRYHILVLNVVPVHYSYSVEDKTWSKHTYVLNPSPAFKVVGKANVTSSQLELGFGGLSASGPNQVLTIWDSGIAPDENATVTGPVVIPTSEEQDNKIQRVLLKGSTISGFANATVSVTSNLGDRTSTRSNTVGFNSSELGSVHRKWFDLQGVPTGIDTDATGQDFQLTLTIPAGKAFQTNYWNMRFDPEGSDFRG